MLPQELLYLQSGDNVLFKESNEATVSIYKFELMLLLLGAGVFCVRRIVDKKNRRALLLVRQQHRSQFNAGVFRYTFQRDLLNLRSLTFASLDPENFRPLNLTFSRIAPEKWTFQPGISARHYLLTITLLTVNNNPRVRFVAWLVFQSMVRRRKWQTHSYSIRRRFRFGWSAARNMACFCKCWMIIITYYKVIISIFDWLFWFVIVFVL